MKRIYVIMMFAASATLFTLGGCKKSSNNNETDLSSEVTTQTDDHAKFSNDDDAVSDDINTTIEQEPTFTGRTNSILCNATVVKDTTGLIRRMTITYNGANCQGTNTRVGVVVLSIPKSMKWKTAGAELNISIQNLKITRIADNKSLTINGTKTITNVSGNLLKDLFNPTSGVTSIVHTVSSSNMSATFDNGTNRLWQIAKKRTFSAPNNQLVVSIEGNSAGGVAVWGINRLGQDFSTRIINPLVIRQDCNWRLVSGKIEHTKLTRPITVTFGLDASGNPTGCPTTGGYYLKAEWTSLSGNAFSVIRPY